MRESVTAGLQEMESHNSLLIIILVSTAPEVSADNKLTEPWRGNAIDSCLSPCGFEQAAYIDDMVPKKRSKRLFVLIGGGAALAAAAGLTFTALSQNIDYFYQPGDVDSQIIETGRRIRLGGLVAHGSVRDGTGVEKIFDVTDGETSITVVYDGILPDLFREGQGVIAQGRFGAGDIFHADVILAKHDENYKPRELEGLHGDETKSSYSYGDKANGTVTNTPD